MLSLAGFLIIGSAFTASPQIAPSINAEVKCDNCRGWSLDVAAQEVACGIRELVLSGASETNDALPRVEIAFRVPQIDVSYVWKSSGITGIPMDWSPPCERASVSQGQPLYALLNAKGINRITLSSCEALRETHFFASYDEARCEAKCRFVLFVGRCAPEKDFEVRIRFDVRGLPYGNTIKAAADWMSADARYVPALVPDVAHESVYSSWYVFHKDLHADVLERECAIASELGMKTLIVDDGWQDDLDGVKDYVNVGGFNISKRRFPDMKAHVKRIKSYGMKYLLWYPISLVGWKSPDYPRFRGKYLADYKHLSASVLDPRFPDVREYLISGFEQAMREYGFDGFKIDFLDMFPYGDGDEKTPGRDYAGVPQAVDRLMSDLMMRLREVNPEALVEFRQGYVGPAIRKFGNIIRVGDCPGDFRANRIGISQLRLTSGKAAVHSDMLAWNPGDSAESASRFILNSIFGTIQYSVRLETLKECHRKMIAHYLRFAREHSKALRHGTIVAEHPESGCPIVTGESEEERIIGLYEHTSVASLIADKKVTYVLNATDSDSIFVECDAAMNAKAYNAFGEEQLTKIEIVKGVGRVSVPRGGYLRIMLKHHTIGGRR